MNNCAICTLIYIKNCCFSYRCNILTIICYIFLSWSLPQAIKGQR
nr:MAG TPA: hypothetical protein [Caudoviricetes sp.]